MPRSRTNEPSREAIYIGIDNGATGSIGIISPIHLIYIPVPKYMEQDYTKKKQRVSRLDVPAFGNLIQDVMRAKHTHVHVLLERPLVNPGMFKATKSALRFMEATMIVLERLGLPKRFIDSKEWQKYLLPKGCKGPELKVASKEIGCRLFPQLAPMIVKHGDADGLLIAEYARRTSGLGG